MTTALLRELWSWRALGLSLIHIFLRLFEVWIVAVGTWLHLVEVELHIGGIGTAAVLVRHFLDLDGLACHIVVLLLLGQFLSLIHI